ncbi:MAG TPA: esterase [Burkholderiaceae bacterium]|nr:esterase [Burkholderiaceae bacterium]
MSDQSSLPPKPLVVLPEAPAPAQLFVLFHGESSSPRQLSGLAAALRQAFPQAAIVLPHGPIRIGTDIYDWVGNTSPDTRTEASRLADAVSALAGLVQQLQQHYGLSGEHTALAGFSQGASLILEACTLWPDLAGRALFFSGRYDHLPLAAPPKTTLHFLHGTDDDMAPVARVGEVHARLAELRGDATLDVASSVGHELHTALIAQAVLRLQTCVPLRSWEKALNELEARDAGDSAVSGNEGRTLH